MIDSEIKNLEDLSEDKSPETQEFENKLRPSKLAEYIGQADIKESLGIAIESAKKRKEPLDHTLLHGPPGLGKTTLANIIAKELNVGIKVSSGPALERQGDLASIISNLEEGDILFIDEIHRLKPVVEEVLYTAMEDFAIDIVLGKGPSARTMRINLPRFTLIGATTKLSLLSSPLRSRFSNTFKLLFYREEEIAEIILRSGGILGCNINEAASHKLATSSRNTPRIANSLLRRVRDYAVVKNDSVIDEKLVMNALKSLGIDEIGLDFMDREILSLMIDRFDGGPVGLNTISAAIHEEQSTVEDIYEPFLIKMGFIERTARGRIVTAKAYKHLGITSSN